MKRMLIVLTALTLLIASCPALAESGKAAALSFEDPVTLAPGQAATLTVKINAVKGGALVYSLTDMKKKTVIYTETRENVQAGQELAFPVLYDDTDLTASKPVKQMRASVVLDEKTYSLNLYYTYSLDKDNKPSVTVEKGDWYYNNTACSFGPAFRDVRPALTDKWYTFTPVDLSVQGTQEFEYIASNMYIIGTVTVSVFGDSVTVACHNFYEEKNGNTETKEAFFTFFPDLASVTEVEPERLQDRAFAFGVPLSIEKDLNGDTNVLLFVRNRVDYCTYAIPTQKLERFWPNTPRHKTLREAMLTLMD